MKLDEVKNYTDLYKYLREFKNWADDPYIYDFGGVVHLMLALLDNIQQDAIEGELEDIGYYFTDAQRQFLARIAEHANRISDKEIDEEDNL